MTPYLQNFICIGLKHFKNWLRRLYLDWKNSSNNCINDLKLERIVLAK